MNRRLLIVGTAYAIREHRKKLSHLAKKFDLTCVTANECGGIGWTERVEPEPSSRDYELVRFPIGGAAFRGLEIGIAVWILSFANSLTIWFWLKMSPGACSGGKLGS